MTFDTPSIPVLLFGCGVAVPKWASRGSKVGISPLSFQCCPPGPGAEVYGYYIDFSQ
jgi:hypothetical protein